MMAEWVFSTMQAGWNGVYNWKLTKTTFYTLFIYDGMSLK
jgi:hypothetical protein